MHFPCYPDDAYSNKDQFVNKNRTNNVSSYAVAFVVRFYFIAAFSRRSKIGWQKDALHSARLRRHAIRYALQRHLDSRYDDLAEYFRHHIGFHSSLHN